MAQQPNMQPTNQPGNNTEPPKKKGLWSWFLYLLLFGALMFFFYPSNSRKIEKDLSYTQFTSYIERDMVEQLIVYDDNSAKATIRPEQYNVVFGNPERAQEVKMEARALLERFSEEGLKDMCARYAEEGISPGGAADMLALTIFIDTLIL